MIGAQQHRRGLLARRVALRGKGHRIHARHKSHAPGERNVAGIGRHIGERALVLHRSGERAVAQRADGHRGHLFARDGVVRAAGRAVAGKDVMLARGFDGAKVPLFRVLIVREAALFRRDGLPAHQAAQRRGIRRARHLLPEAELAAAGALKQIVLFALRDALRRPVLVRHVGIARFVGGKRKRRGHHESKKQRRQAHCDLFHCYFPPFG